MQTVRVKFIACLNSASQFLYSVSVMKPPPVTMIRNNFIK